MENIRPTYDERKAYLSAYTEKHPFKDVFLLGRSILSRDIDCIKAGCGKSHIVVVGAHHGAEYITTLAIFDFLEFISEKFTRRGTYCGVDIRLLLQKFTFWIVPCLNPDGVELSLTSAPSGPLRERELRMNGSFDFALWQANARGVDLNHNYDYRFAEYKTYEQEHGIVAGRSLFSGEYPESEPETKSLANLIRTIAPRLVISLHSQGEELFSMPKNPYMHKLSAHIASAIGCKYKEPHGSAEYGGLCDYTGGVLGIPSFTLEVGRGENPLPESELPAVCDSVRRMLVLLPTYI